MSLDGCNRDLLRFGIEKEYDEQHFVYSWSVYRKLEEYTLHENLSVPTFLVGIQRRTWAMRTVRLMNAKSHLL